MSGLSPMLRQYRAQPPQKIKKFKKELKQDFVISNTDIYNVMIRSVINNSNICVYNHSIPIFTQYYYDKENDSQSPVKLNEATNKLEYINFKKENLRYQTLSKLGSKFKEFQNKLDKIWDNFLYFYEDCKGSVIILPLTIYFYDKDEKGKLFFVGTHNNTLLIDKITKICVYLDSPKDFPRKKKFVNQQINYSTKYFQDFLHKLNVIQGDILGRVFPFKIIPLPTPSFVSTQRLHSFWTLFLTDLILHNYGREIEYGKLKNIDIRKTINSLFEKYNEFRLNILFNQYISYLTKIKESVVPKNKGFFEKYLGN